MKIESLTPEQEKMMEIIVKEYEDNTLSGDDSYSQKHIEESIDYLYSLTDLKTPEIIICNSPGEIIDLAKLKKGETLDYFGTGYDSGWTAFYDFMQKIGVEYDKDWQFDKWLSFIKHSGSFALLLYENVAFVCIKPCEVSRDKEGNLHNDTSVAIGWRDGWGLYFLHGVGMEEEHILIPSDKMTPEMVIKEENVEVRRELIRKFGADRLKSYGKVIDKQDEYELLDMSKIFTSVDYAPHLLMKNPSIGVYRLEGVGQECKTVQQAINWRAGDIKNNWIPSILT